MLVLPVLQYRTKLLVVSCMGVFLSCSSWLVHDLLHFFSLHDDLHWIGRHLKNTSVYGFCVFHFFSWEWTSFLLMALTVSICAFVIFCYALQSWTTRNWMMMMLPALRLIMQLRSSERIYSHSLLFVVVITFGSRRENKILFTNRPQVYHENYYWTWTKELLPFLVEVPFPGSTPFLEKVHHVSFRRLFVGEILFPTTPNDDERKGD